MIITCVPTGSASQYSVVALKSDIVESTTVTARSLSDVTVDSLYCFTYVTVPSMGENSCRCAFCLFSVSSRSV